MKRVWWIIVVAALVIAAGGIYLTKAGHSPAGQPALVEVNSSTLAALQNEFNRTSDRVRIILLISPT